MDYLLDQAIKKNSRGVKRQDQAGGKPCLPGKESPTHQTQQATRGSTQNDLHHTNRPEITAKEELEESKKVGIKRCLIENPLT